MTGVVLGALLAQKEAVRRGQDGSKVCDMLVWVLIAGIIGARIWHILTPTPSAIAAGLTTEYYLTHPLEAIAIWNGGLGIFGAVAGGAVALYFFTRRHHLSLLLWLNGQKSDKSSSPQLCDAAQGLVVGQRLQPFQSGFDTSRCTWDGF